MKTFKFVLLLFMILPIFSACFDKELEEEAAARRTTHVVTLENNTGTTGCSAEAFKVTYLVSYRDILVDVDVAGDRSTIINVLVEDNESINIKVRRASDDSLFADSDIKVRTTSRPDNLQTEFRRISYCQAFNLSFANF